MESTCTFGFEDLFWAAHGRTWTPLERRALDEADQDTRNAIVRDWARAAGSVALEDRTGSDGLVYSAFRFERPDWWTRLRWLTPMSGSVALAAFGPPSAGAADGTQSPPVDPATGPVVLAVGQAGGPLVPGKGVAVTHGRNVGDAIVRVRAVIRGIEASVVHAGVVDDAAGDLATWLAEYLRCSVA